jgi:hypothetical protein
MYWSVLNGNITTVLLAINLINFLRLLGDTCIFWNLSEVTRKLPMNFVLLEWNKKCTKILHIFQWPQFPVNITKLLCSRNHFQTTWFCIECIVEKVKVILCLWITVLIIAGADKIESENWSSRVLRELGMM